eukprot:scaffold1599_cov68-Phaeocystis_antarctica.AAC.1
MPVVTVNNLFPHTLQHRSSAGCGCEGPTATSSAGLPTSRLQSTRTLSGKYVEGPLPPHVLRAARRDARMRKLCFLPKPGPP